MQKSILKKIVLACFSLLFGTQVFAQGRIELNPTSRGVQISESDFKGFNSTFSFSSIESTITKGESENFSIISIENTVNHGELGAPALPIARKLIAVPFEATPVVKVVNYSTTDYNLSDFGIEKIYPQQPSYSKSTKEEDMVFHYDESAYQATRAFNNAPEVSLKVLGTMRGVQIGALQIEPVEYNPANNTVRVYNDIELEVVFENADIALTEETLIKTYSPYFDVVYKQLFNERTINDVYNDHPDLYTTPVKMLVVANRMFEDVMQPWLEWKTQKGFYLDVKYTDELGSGTADDIKAYVQQQYETEAPSFLVIFGDKDQVAPSRSSGQETGRVTDLYYATFDGDEFPDLYHSRMCCETVEEMEALINKTLQVEQYTMPDPSYLNNVLMIAGADGHWNPLVGQPTIEYATHYYFNEEHGFDNVYKYLSTYTGCYNNLNTGVGFANYTAHGGQTSWSDPSFTVADVNTLTNVDKYFWAMGNCCLAADWGYSSTSFGEAMIRAEQKGAWGYIGSCPLTYWWEDYYFGVGATTHTGSMPTMEQTTMGNYDAFWMEDTYNTLASVPFSGNLAVAYAHVDGGYGHAVSTRYYFEAYHTLGDGSVMPYKTQPTENVVTHLPTLPIGMDYYTVSAAPGSYVGISQAGTLYGAGMIDEAGETDIPLEPITAGGDVTIVVTHPERIPYIATVPAAAMEGAFIAVDDFSPRTAPTNEEVSLSVSYKNVGVDATEGTTTITLSSENDNITIIDGEASFDVLNADAIVELSNEFSFIISENAQDGDVITVNSIATCGSDTWEGKINISVVAPILEFVGYSWLGSFEPGETYTVMAQFENSGHYMAENVVATISSTSEYLTIEEESYEIGTIDPDGVGTAMFEVTVSSSCPTSEAIDLAFEVTAENAQPAQGEGVIQNACNVVITMNDTYGDGWNNSYLTFAYNDGTPSQNISITSGSSGVENLTIGTGVNVVVTFVSGSQWDSEISFSIAYEDGDVIYQSSGTPTSGVVCEFTVNCAGGEGPDVNDNTIINYGSYSLKFTVTDVFPAECEVVCETKPTSPTTITIPSIVTFEEVECSVTSIGNDAFKECSNLTSILIPSSITSIGNSAFESCSSLTSIKCHAAEVPETSSNAFYSCPSEMTIQVPAASVVAYKAANPWKNYNITALSEYVIGNGTESGYDAPFNNYYKYSWNETIYQKTDIGGACTFNSISYHRANSDNYDYETSMINIYMGETTRSSMSSETDWTPSSSLTLVYSGNDITIGDSEWETFTLQTPFEYSGNNNLVVVVAKTANTYTNTLKWYYTSTSSGNKVSMYRQNDSSTSYAQHPGTATGTQLAYAANIKLGIDITTNIEIGDYTIIDYAGYSLKFTVTDVFPAECEVVCETKPTSPTTITIPSIVTIEEVECSVTSIGNDAFKECSRLTSILIPSSITSIGNSAFESCSSLTSIKCHAAEVPETDLTAFDYCPSDMTIQVPAGSVEAYQAASPWNNYNILAIHTINGDGSWEDISNWDNQILPDEYGNVVVAGHVTISTEVIINSLDINEDKSLTILNGGTLTVMSDITNTDVNALIIEEGGQIIQYNDNVAATFKNEIIAPTGTWGEEDQTGWQFISSPINNVNVDEFIPENGNYDLFKYDGTNKLWINMRNIENASFEKGIGYLASYENAENMALFKGNLNYLASGGSYVIEDLNYSGNENVLANFHLLGNPFPFDINWSTDVTTSNVYNGFARIKPSDGAYEYFTSSGTIKSGEGFMVKTTGDNASITFSKGSSKAYRKEAKSVNIIASNSKGSDNLIVSLDDNEKAGFPKLDNFNENIANVYVRESEVNYGIFNYGNDINEIPFYFNAKEIGNYTLTFDIEGEFDNLYLLDKMTGEKVNILMENEYSFMANSNDNPERFVLLTKTKNEDESHGIENFVYINNDDLYINAEGTIQIIDMMGRIIMTEENHNGVLNISNLNSAAYIVRCVNENEVKTQKIVVL